LTLPIPSALQRGWLPTGLAIYQEAPEEAVNASATESGCMMFLTRSPTASMSSSHRIAGETKVRFLRYAKPRGRNCTSCRLPTS
jgi:hypothetical protein